MHTQQREQKLQDKQKHPKRIEWKQLIETFINRYTFLDSDALFICIGNAVRAPRIAEVCAALPQRKYERVLLGWQAIHHIATNYNIN